MNAKIKMLNLHHEEPILVRDFGKIKYWTTKDHLLNTRELQKKSFKEIEKLFKKGIIPIKSLDESLKTVHGVYTTRRWYYNKRNANLHMNFINFFSLNYLFSILLIISSVFLLLKGNNITGSFIIDDLRLNNFSSTSWLFIFSLCYFLFSTVLILIHHKTLREKSRLFVKS